MLASIHVLVAAESIDNGTEPNAPVRERECSQSSLGFVCLTRDFEVLVPSLGWVRA